MKFVMGSPSSDRRLSAVGFVARISVASKLGTYPRASLIESYPCAYHCNVISSLHSSVSMSQLYWQIPLSKVISIQMCADIQTTALQMTWSRAVMSSRQSSKGLNGQESSRW